MPMQTAFRSERRFTQEEFWEWLRDGHENDIYRYELIDGQIVMSPPAGYDHGKVGARIGASLLRHVSALALGDVLDSSTGYDLPSGDTLEPDVSFISNARLATGPKPARGRFGRIVPDLVVEVLSYSTAKRDRTEKKEIYARNGVDEYWLVDVDRREVTVFRRDGVAFSEPAVFASGRVRSRVLPGIDLAIEDLFAGVE